MPAGEIIAPHGYSLWWGGLGLLLLVLVVAGWMVLWRSTRTPRITTAVMEPGSTPSVDGVADPWANPRNAALARITVLEDRYQAGNLPGRQVHQDLSVIVRDFTTARTGLDATALTLSELQRHRDAAPATAIITDLYSPEFAAHATGEPLAAIEQTREVITRW